MESDASFRQYKERRDRMYERLDAIRAQVSEWLEQHANAIPALTDIARLEALHAERGEVIADFHQTENAFIDYLLEQRRREA